MNVLEKVGIVIAVATMGAFVVLSALVLVTKLYADSL